MAATKRRAWMDGVAWNTIDSHVLPLQPYRKASRPGDYAELWEAIQAYQPWPGDEDCMPWTWPAFEHAWSNFLHEFFYWRTAEFFAVKPPPQMDSWYRVLLAGAAEYLCNRYDLDKPDWLEDADMFLPELTEMWPHGQRGRGVRAKKAAPEFLRRNLIFEARGLITL